MPLSPGAAGQARVESLAQQLPSVGGLQEHQSPISLFEASGGAAIQAPSPLGSGLTKLGFPFKEAEDQGHQEQLQWKHL